MKKRRLKSILWTIWINTAWDEEKNKPFWPFWITTICVIISLVK